MIRYDANSFIGSDANKAMYAALQLLPEPLKPHPFKAGPIPASEFRDGRWRNAGVGVPQRHFLRAYL